MSRFFRLKEETPHRRRDKKRHRAHHRACRRRRDRVCAVARAYRRDRARAVAHATARTPSPSRDCLSHARHRRSCGCLPDRRRRSRLCGCLPVFGMPPPRCLLRSCYCAFAAASMQDKAFRLRGYPIKGSIWCTTAYMNSLLLPTPILPAACAVACGSQPPCAAM